MKRQRSNFVLVELQVKSSSVGIPDQKFFEICVQNALKAFRESGEITIRVVDREEGRKLNQRWRGVNEATNVLAFTAEGVEHAKPGLLGDLVLCAPVICSEARAQGKSRQKHWAHMIVHGVLHLLEFDHKERGRAEEMENWECAILSEMGYPNPYER